MIRYRCDACGADLARDGSNHFIVKVEAFAAAGKLEFTAEEVERDHSAELHKLVEDLRSHSPDDIEDQVFRAFRYDLCPPCHKSYIASPIAAIKR